MPRTADDDARALAHRDVNAATETNGDAMCDAAMKPNDEKDARDDDAGEGCSSRKAVVVSPAK